MTTTKDFLKPQHAVKIIPESGELQIVSSSDDNDILYSTMLKKHLPLIPQVEVLYSAWKARNMDMRGKTIVFNKHFKKKRNQSKFASKYIKSIFTYLKTKDESNMFKKIVSNSNYERIYSDGEYAQIGISGDCGVVYSEGDKSQIGNGGDYVGITSNGDGDQIGIGGDNANIASNGDDVKIGIGGDNVAIQINGDGARIGSCGTYALIFSEGSDSVIACAYAPEKIRLGNGGAISIPYKDAQGRIRFQCFYAGEDDIKPGTVYAVITSESGVQLEEGQA